MASRILIVDDDQEICSLVKAYLERSEFEVDVAHDGASAKSAVSRTAFDLLLLDVMLPGQSGLDLCRDLRSTSSVPIIMLTAMGQLADKVTGLELGADDYMVKPFEPRELLARARAAVRRRQTGEPEAGAGRHALDGMVVDPGLRSVTAPDGENVALTFAEFELLALLLAHANATLPRAQILQQVFGRSAGLYDRSVDVLLSRLRRKLAKAGITLAIESVRAVGYMLVGQVTRC
ncbi:response regulator transcription factor [Aestuariivirga litoralis]|nr:response regulator transcription factor [Aestuariivirga litoralis]